MLGGERRLPLSVQANILHQLSELLKQGYSFSQALKITESSAKGQEKKIITKLETLISTGLPLAEAFQQSSFSPDVSVMVAQAEMHGDLPQALAKASEWKARQIRFKTELKKAVAYPFFLLVLIGLIIYILFQFVIPQFMFLFETYDLFLPKITQLVFTIIAMVERYIWLIPLLLGAIFFILFFIMGNQSLQKQFLSLLVRLPLIRRGVRLYLTILFCTQLGYLLYAHVSLYHALEKMAQNDAASYLGERARDISQQLLTGETLSEVLAKEISFVPQLSTLVYFAEKNGKLAQHLIEYGHYLEQSFLDRWIERLKWLEPALLIIIGLAIAYLFMAMMMPIFQLMEAM